MSYSGSCETFSKCSLEGAFTLMPLPKLDEVFALLKRANTLQHLISTIFYYHIKLDKESIPKSAFITVFSTFEFLRLPFGLSQGPDFSSILSL